jgi:nicotinate-nucleotide adenylyltransferase
MRAIGLLGGSFNPAHDGHRHISLLALKRLRLSAVWWMVAPRNPLKDAADLAPFEARVRQARAVARHPRIHVSAIERDVGTTYTVDTLAVLVRRFRDVRFVWLMGADNLVQISTWEQWERIFRLVPIAVLVRPSYAFKAHASIAARRFARARLAEARAAGLAWRKPPAWVFLHIRPHPASATLIRARRSNRGLSPARDA